MGTKNSDLIANFEATPSVKSSAALLSGVVRVAQGTVSLATGDSDDNDIVMLAPIPSNAVVSQLFIGSDTLGGSCTFNVGIYTSTVADEAAMTDLRFEAADINTAGQQLWQLAGDSEDPGGYFYIAATMAAAGGTAGDMSFNIHYVIN